VKPDNVEELRADALRLIRAMLATLSPEVPFHAAYIVITDEDGEELLTVPFRDALH
jgi:hypothetical protein